MTKTMDELCVNTIRTLAMDAVQRANSGHPRTPMALAPVVAVTDVLDHRSGLLGVSGIGNDMRALLESPAPEAAEAVALLVYRAGRARHTLACIRRGGPR